MSQSNNYDLTGKVAIVIGGAGYLCSSLSSALHQSGAKVVILDRVDEPVVDVGSKISWDRYLRCDVTKKEALLTCREQILDEFGHVDVLLNGAGTNAPTTFFEITEDEFQVIIDVNLKAVLLACQVFGEVMLSQGSGSIINFASVSSGPPLSKAFIYSVAKAGVYNLTQNLAREWAPHKVRVNALRPGFFPTNWSMKNFINKERKAQILNHTPMGRFGGPEELIGAVLWLASEDATFVTGSLVTVDGGFTAMTI